MSDIPPPPDANPDSTTRGEPLPPEPEPRRRNRTGMLIASGIVLAAFVIGIALLLSAIWGDDPDPDSVEDVAAEMPGETPVPEIEATLPEGSVRVEGESGTVRGTGGEEPEEVPAGIDLTAVELSSDGETLTVTYESADEIPESVEEPTTVIWAVQTSDEETLRYNLEAQLDSSGWTIGVHTLDPNRYVELPGPPEISGNQLTVEYPATSLPELSEHFGWSAYAEWGDEQDVWGDMIPDADEDAYTGEMPADQRLTFPEE